MKKIKISIILLFTISLNLFSQTCYESMLVDVKNSMEKKEYKIVIFTIDKIIKNCQDIPSNNPLEAIKRTALAFDSIDNAAKPLVVKQDSIKPIVVPKTEDKGFINQIIKVYGLTETDLKQSKRINFDFNNDGLQDIAMLFYFERKSKSNIKTQVKFMSIAVFEQSKTKTFTLKNKADKNNMLLAGCQLESLGIKSFEKIENGIFFFSNADKKCTVKCTYDTKTNKIQIIK